MSSLTGVEIFSVLNHVIFSASELPNAPARHCIDEMSPTVELKQSDMTKQQQKTLTKASKVLKRPAALKRKQSFLIVGGDNSTESEISRVKGQMRRTNMLGRISPRNAQVQQFAAKRLLEAWVDASGDGFCGISQRSKKTNGYSTRSRVSN